MKVLTFSKRTTLHTTIAQHKSQIVVNPGTRIVLDDISAQAVIAPKDVAMTNGALPGYLLNYSDISPYLCKSPKRDWKDRNVLFMRKRGIGDELCLTAIPRYFNDKFGANCYVLCHASTESIWQHNDTIRGVVGEPLYLDSIHRDNGRPFFEHSFFFESVTEWDSEPDQGNVYDTLFRMAGVNPKNVDDRYKKPYIRLHKDEQRGFLSWQEGACSEYESLDLSQGYIVHQLSTTNEVRNVPEKKELEILAALEKSNKPVLVVDDKLTTPDIDKFLGESKNIFNVTCRIPTLRLYFSIIAGASCVIGPDSSALHVAAAFDVPSIGLWGPFSYQSRAKYYPKHYPIWANHLCPNAPCYNFAPKLPFHLCPQGNNQKHCEVFEGISEKQVTDLLETLKLI